MNGNYESLSKKTILANKYIFDRFDGKFDFVLKVRISMILSKANVSLLELTVIVRI